MSSSSNSSSAPSPSPPASPEASFHGPASLELLIAHFVSAKRSLTSSTHVSRANELVTSSRVLVEEIAVLNAKNAFARRGVDEQIETLHAIRDGVAEVGDKAALGLKGTLAALDKANARLQSTLASLRKTVVDVTLQRQQSGNTASSPTESDPDSQKTLYDFIDEANHEDILASLRQLIDSFNDARSELDGDVQHFSDDLSAISDVLLAGSHSAGPKDKRTIYDEPPPSIPQLFHGMEEHATEMATLLQSLVTHYDLCVTALKHTEGGGEAARLAVQQVATTDDKDEPPTKPTPGEEESLYSKKAPVPISADERTQMLGVLAHDAEQVDDVVCELRDRSAELEAQYAQLTAHCGHSRTTHKQLREVLTLLHRMRDALPMHLHAASTLRESWRGIQAEMAARTKELAQLTTFHAGFAAGYGRLLVEIERRGQAAGLMERVAAKARREMEKLWIADREARERFMEEVGGFLPKDIYPALGEEGVRWDVRPVGADGEGEM